MLKRSVRFVLWRYPASQRGLVYTAKTCRASRVLTTTDCWELGCRPTVSRTIQLFHTTGSVGKKALPTAKRESFSKANSSLSAPWYSLIWNAFVQRLSYCHVTELTCATSAFCLGMQDLRNQLHLVLFLCIRALINVHCCCWLYSLVCFKTQVRHKTQMRGILQRGFTDRVIYVVDRLSVR